MNTSKRFFMHYPLPETISAYVKTVVFYDLDKELASNDEYGELTPVKLFGISFYEGQTPTFQVITPEGAVFSDVPLDYIFHKKEAINNEVNYKLNELVYFNCPTSDVIVVKFAHLSEKKNSLVILNQSKNYRMNGDYLLSVDFYNENNWFHLMKLANGQFCFIPSHKILFSRNNLKSLPKYKKMKNVIVSV